MHISPEHSEDLLGAVRQWAAAHGTPEDLAELEAFAAEVSRAVGRAVVEQGLAAHGEKAGYEGSSRPCECGKKAKFVDYRHRWVTTLFGPVSVHRAYYHCRHCRASAVPWDRRQGLSSLVWSPHVKGLMAQAAGRLPYSEAVLMMSQLAGVEIEESGAERIVAEVGGRLRDADAALMQSYDCGEVIPLVPQAPQRLYVSMDGTSAHIDGSWHEVKTGVVYEGVPDKDGIDTSANARYVAAQEPAERFGERLYVAAAQAGVEHAAQTIVTGDGAEWIWNLAKHHYPWATEILDYWHAAEHIHSLAQALYGPDSTQGQRWAQDHCRWLKERGPATLLRSLKRMKPKTAQQAEVLERERGYFARNRQRMDYHRYRQQGMMIGSGPVEAGCKTVVGARLKQSGMRWSSPGADAVLAIRTALLSGHQDRVQTMAKAA